MKKASIAIFAGILCLIAAYSGCRQDPREEKEKISSIEFDLKSVEVNVNEDVIVRVTAKSDEGKKNEKIKYTSVNEGFIQIREASNDGFIVRGLKVGSTIVRAQSQDVDKLLEVKVYGEDVLSRYIKLSKPVIEVEEGMQVQTSVSLYGRVVEPDDNSLFQWQLEAGKNNIAVNATANILVIKGLERGHQEIIIKHPRASFDNKILVFVKGVDEVIKYIYRDSNILVMPNDGQYHDFDVVLINGEPSDAVGFTYEVTDGNENIEEISGAQTKCNIMAKKSGLSTVRVSHPLAIVDFDVRVVIYDLDVPYITLDNSFLLLNVLESERVIAEVENARNGIAHKSQFDFRILENNAEVPKENSIIEVIQTNESFYIRAKNAGTARVVISNEQAETSREVLVVVREEPVYRDDYYISVDQNVITTQIGADLIRLNARLVNGNSADANNMIWDVDDSTIIKLITNHGTVRNRATIKQLFDSYAQIEPLKVGTAKITITNTKWPDTLAQVIVRVYPKGTFAEPPLRIGGDGLIKLEYPRQETVQLRVTEGDESKIKSNLSWTVTPSGIASFPMPGLQGLTNIMQAAVDAGSLEPVGALGKLTVTGGGIEAPHEAIVMAGNEAYLNSISVIYADNVYQKVVEQQTIDVHILNSKTNAQGKPDENWQPTGFTAKVRDQNIAYAVMVRNVLKIMGKERGETDIVVRHSDAVNESITIHLRVEPAYISIDQPYYITGPEIKGVVRQINTELSVDMPGAPETEKQKLVWASNDTAIVTVSGAGTSVMLYGNTLGQTFVTAGHKNNKAPEKQMLVYVVASAADLDNVILGTRQQNYLLKTGQEQLVTLITNASDKQKLNIEWNVVTKPGDPVPVTIDPHYDSAMIRAYREGIATVEVTYTDYDDKGNPTGKVTTPLSIYVSVVDSFSDEKIIKSPAVVEITRGESRIINVEYMNLSQTDIMNIKWDVETAAGEEPLANIEGNGDSAYIYGLRRGVGRVKIWQEDIRYTHYATLICTNPGETAYVMGVDSSYQKMIIGEEKKVKLTFGNNGFPETAKRNLRWTADSSGKVKIAGSPGESVSIVALEPGEATVTVTDGNNPRVSFNETLEMKFMIIDPNRSSLEFRGHQKMVGVVVGSANKKQVHIRLYDNDEEIKNYHLWSHEAEKGNIIRVNRADADPAGQILDIEALAAGESYITVRYNNEVSARILVYTALTEDDLASYYPILVEKSNYLLQVGGSAAVKIETMAEKDAANFSKVSWGIEGANFIEEVDTVGKKEFTIKGKFPGQCIISVNYTDKGTTQTKAKIFVTVVSDEDIDYTKYIVTESIVGLKMGTNKNTRIFHNLGAGVSNVVWSSLNPSIVTVSGSGDEATLRPAGTGETYVTVTYGTWLKRHIRVYVTGAAADTGNYRAMNIENQYYRAGLGETFELPVFFAPVKSAVATVWDDLYRNNVVKYEGKENGSKIEITPINEGVAVLEARNTGIDDTSHVLRIYVEVSKKYNGIPKQVVNRFLTMSKTIYVMNPDNTDEELNLTINGVGYSPEEMAKVTWALADDNGKSGSLISIYPNGKECRVKVNPAGKEGTAEIVVSKTENEIVIRIVVSRTGMIGYPHIAGEGTVRLGLHQKTSVIYEVAETGTYDLNGFAVQIMGSGSNYVNARFNKNVLELEGKMSGQAVLRITCVPTVSAEHYKDVAVLVTTNADGLIYLTTRDNFTQVKIGEAKTVSVDMAGISNPSESGYTWEIADEDEKYLKLSYTGRQAQVEGLEQGAGQTIKVTVKNTLVDDLFALTMWVRVSDNFFNTMYLTTQQNVVTVYEGRSTYLTAELVNGMQGEETMISWQSLDPDIADVMGTGTQAFVIGNHLGFARIQAQYNKAVNKQVEILVIVEKDTTSESIYITSNDGMVQMKPGDTRQLSVRLVGGSMGDEYGFNWEIYTQNPAAQNNQVISIETAMTGTDKVIVRALSEGDATVRVTHRKSSYILDLKIYVQEYNKVEFDAEMLTMNAGEEKIVRVTMPPNTSVRYVVDKPNIIRLSDVGPTSSGFLVITALNVTTMTTVKITAASVEKPLTDEMLVTVNPVVNRSVQYIKTNDTIFNLLDWQSPSNRAVVSGIPVGEKPGGGEFTDADSSVLKWNITSGSQFIEFDLATDAQKTQTVGKVASIATKKTGTAEITATHPEMPGYSKKVYVNVAPYETNFRLNPVFKSMQIGDQTEFSVSIVGKVDSSEYKNVTWRILSNEEGQYGVRFIDKAAGDTFYERAGRIGMDKVAVIAEKDGAYKLKAIYEGRELETIIFVAKEKAFEIFDDTFFKIVPNTTYFVGLYHEPVITGKNNGPKETWMNIKENQNHQMVEIGYCGPIRDENNQINANFLPVKGYYKGSYNQDFEYDIRSAFNDAVKSRLNSFVDPEGRGRKYNALLVLRGTEMEGYSTIKIEHANIERAITVHNNSEYSFRVISVRNTSTNQITETQVVRGKPGQRFVIKYEILPVGSKIKGVPNNGNTLMGDAPSVLGKKIVNVGGINLATQEITIELLEGGYTKLRFTDDFNDEGIGQTLDIPVYIYYNRIDLTWKKNNTDGISRIDALGNAIYIANNEILKVDIIKKSDGQVIDKDDLEFSGISFNGSNKLTSKYDGTGFEIKSIALNNNNIEYARAAFCDKSYLLGFEVRGPLNKEGSYYNGTDQTSVLREVTYVGVLTVHYEYSNGGLSKAKFSKNFLVYYEKRSN